MDVSQKYCKQKGDLPWKSLQIKENGYHGLITPRAPEGALFKSLLTEGCLGYQATWTTMARASVILQASKTIHSRSLWSGRTFHEKVYLINENKRKVRGLVRQVCLSDEPLLCTFSDDVCKTQSFFSDALLQAIVAIQNNLLYMLILWSIPSICLILSLSKLALPYQLIQGSKPHTRPKEWGDTVSTTTGEPFHCDLLSPCTTLYCLLYS